MEFQITILGSNSAIPAHGRNQSSQMVTVGSSYLLLDCGEGTQIQLRRFKLKFSRIDFIFISHLHGDHYYGLMGLISSFHLVKRDRLLTIFGPPGLDEIITVQLKHTQTKLSFPVRFVPLSDDRLNLILEERTFRVYSFPLHHRISCTGFLVEEKHGLRNLVKEKLQEKKLPLEAINSLRSGQDCFDENGNLLYAVADYTYPPRENRKYAYCSDTKYAPALAEYVNGADLLYHEATFGEDEVERAASTFHSTARQAAMIAQESNVKQLMLGHYSSRYRDLSPLLDEAKQVFPDTILSEEGITYTIE